MADALNTTVKSADARKTARVEAFNKDRQKYDSAAESLSKRLQAAGVDVAGYLTASKSFIEAGTDSSSRATAEAVNAKYAAPIRTALDQITGIANVADLLQAVQGAPSNIDTSQPAVPLGGSLPSCCSTLSFAPPWEGLYTEGDFGARTIRPGPTTQLAPQIRSAVVAAPHRLEKSGRRITVPANARSIRIDATLDTSWVIGLSGLGYAHVWLGLDLDVTIQGGTVVCRAPHLEQDNQWTWAGGFLFLSDHRPGPRITRTCTFERAATDPVEYAVNVAAASDGTFFGFSGGYGDYFVRLGAVDVTSCP